MAEPFQRALVIVAHPDDAESLAAGTVAKLTRAGTQVAYCIATNGEKGSGDRSMTPERLATVRQEEQRQASRVLGVRSVEFLGFPDCEVENTRPARLAITAAIRRHRPNLLLVQNPHRTKRLGASHRDHRIVAQTALDCVPGLIGARLAFPELLAQGLEPHVVEEVRLMVWENPRGGQGGDGCAGASPELLGGILPVWPDGAHAQVESEGIVADCHAFSPTHLCSWN